MPNYTVLNSSIPPRDPALLSKEPVRGIGGVILAEPPYNQVAPGLYPDESVVALDTGETIAVSIEEDFNEHNSSVHLKGVARWIEENGSTKLTIDNKHIETVCSVVVSQAQITEHSLNTLRTEVLKVLLNEPPATRPVPVDPAAVATDSGHNPSQSTAPLVLISQEQRDSANIRNAIATAVEMASQPLPAALL